VSAVAVGVVGVVGVGVGVGVLSSSFDTAGSSVSPALSCVVCALGRFISLRLERVILNSLDTVYDYQCIIFVHSTLKSNSIDDTDAFRMRY
jgi:hypothetical protein